MLKINDWPKRPRGGYLKMTTGHPVIMVVIPVVKEKKTAVPASISVNVEVNEKEFAASTMAGELTGQSYSEKTD